MSARWLETLGLLAGAAGLLLIGTGIHYIIRTLDAHYGARSVRWALGRPRGVLVRVVRPRPAPPKVPRRSTLACFFSGRHPNAVRHPLGGFRCPDCGVAGASLEDMGFKGGGYVRRRGFYR